MELERLAIPEVALLRPKIFGDSRGFFLESWHRRKFAELGLDLDFVQDNHSRSERHILRGMHYQVRHAQGKLVRVAPAKEPAEDGDPQQIEARRIRGVGGRVG